MAIPIFKGRVYGYTYLLKKYAKKRMGDKTSPANIKANTAQQANTAQNQRIFYAAKHSLNILL